MGLVARRCPYAWAPTEALPNRGKLFNFKSIFNDRPTVYTIENTCIVIWGIYFTSFLQF
jgi:hypothetical protein